MSSYEELKNTLASEWGEELAESVDQMIAAKLGAASHSNDPNTQRMAAKVNDELREDLETKILDALRAGNKGEAASISKQLQSAPFWPVSGENYVR